MSDIETLLPFSSETGGFLVPEEMIEDLNRSQRRYDAVVRCRVAYRESKKILRPTLAERLAAYKKRSESG